MSLLILFTKTDKYTCYKAYKTGKKLVKEKKYPKNSYPHANRFSNSKEKNEQIIFLFLHPFF